MTWSSSLLDVEAHRAGRRLGLDPGVVARAVGVVTLIVPTEETLVSARSVGSTSLRTLDALHLAAALELGDDLDGVVTYDRRLAASAAAAGCTVVSPGLGDGWWEQRGD